MLEVRLLPSWLLQDWDLVYLLRRPCAPGMSSARMGFTFPGSSMKTKLRRHTFVALEGERVAVPACIVDGWALHKPFLRQTSKAVLLSHEGWRITHNASGLWALALDHIPDNGDQLFREVVENQEGKLLAEAIMQWWGRSLYPHPHSNPPMSAELKSWCLGFITEVSDALQV